MVGLRVDWAWQGWQQRLLPNPIPPHKPQSLLDSALDPRRPTEASGVLGWGYK